MDKLFSLGGETAGIIPIAFGMGAIVIGLKSASSS